MPPAHVVAVAVAVVVVVGFTPPFTLGDPV